MKIVLLGPPGTGKGTQAKLISHYFNIPHISTGDMFREAAAEGTKIGVKARDEYWGKGSLVPDEITIELVKGRLKRGDCRKGFLLDGFPRTIGQAEALDEITRIDSVIDIESSEEVIVKRLTSRLQCRKCGKIYGLDIPPKKKGVCDDCNMPLYQRDDDRESVVRERLNVYKKQTRPLIDFYKKKGLLRIVDGEKAVAGIFEDIKKIFLERKKLK